MRASEPSRHWQLQKHQQILNQDSPTAFAQLSEIALPHLVSFLKNEFHQVETHVQETAVIDCLLTYHSAPEKYDPEKLTLFAYLRMAARHDLLNAIDHHNRQIRPLLDIDEPGIQEQLGQTIASDYDPNYLEEWLDISPPASRQSLLQSFEQTLDSTDRQLFLLMLNGVRETESYAEILQVAELPLTDQRQAVKRNKDRLIKKLRRYVKRQSV